MIGIYKITNTITDKFYIGSSIDVKRRHREHLTDLKGNSHHSYMLQRAFNKYGADKFKFEVIEECEECELRDREQWYLDNFQPYIKTNGYNINPTAFGGRDVKLSEETKSKISKSLIGKMAGSKHPQYGKTGEKSYWYGKHLSEETKEKLSKSKIGKYLGENHPNYGKKMSDAQKEKLRKSAKETKLSVGEKNPNSKITVEQVREIRSLYSTGKYFHRQLGEMFCIKKSQIGNIVNYISWKDVIV